MGNNSSTSMWINEITAVNELGTAIVEIKLDNNTLFFDAKQIEIKVGDNKVKVSILEFMVAFKYMLDTGVFEMDQIDSEVWDIENKLEVIGNQNDYLNETLREIRGGF